MGGFDTPRQFSERLKADAANGGLPAAAGDMGTPEKQAAGDAAVSRFAAGVDCPASPAAGGWTGPFHTELPALCTRLPSWGRPPDRDILIVPGRHVLLFIQWEGTEKSRFLGSEAGPLPAWKCSEHVFSRSMLENSGYRPHEIQGHAGLKTSSGTSVPLFLSRNRNKGEDIGKHSGSFPLPPSIKRNPASHAAGMPGCRPPRQRRRPGQMPGITTAVRSYGTPSPGRRSQVPSEAE
ncbi:MAG: hypothetical protein ACLT38_04435 [Akkermansia sp.]